MGEIPTAYKLERKTIRGKIPVHLFDGFYQSEHAMRVERPSGEDGACRQGFSVVEG